MRTFYYFDVSGGGEKRVERRRRERSDGTLGTFLPLFFLSQSVFFSPSLPTYGVRYSKCGVSIIWTLLRDHAPSVRRAARITH